MGLQEELSRHDQQLRRQLLRLRRELIRESGRDRDALRLHCGSISEALDGMRQAQSDVVRELCDTRSSAAAAIKQLGRDQIAATRMLAWTLAAVLLLIVALLCLWPGRGRDPIADRGGVQLSVLPAAAGGSGLLASRWRFEAPFVQSTFEQLAECRTPEVRPRESLLDITRSSSWHSADPAGPAADLRRYLDRHPHIVLAIVEAGHDAMEIRDDARPRLPSNRELAERRVDFVRGQLATILAGPGDGAGALAAQLPTVIGSPQSFTSSRPGDYCNDRIPRIILFATESRSLP